MRKIKAVNVAGYVILISPFLALLVLATWALGGEAVLVFGTVLAVIALLLLGAWLVEK